jgi:anti-sigma-K factor RskA
MNDVPRLDDESDMLAAEYALGLLGAEETLAARTRIARDAAFAGRVDWWNVRLAPLLDELGGAEPGDELTDRILALSEEGSGVPDSAEIVRLHRRERRWRWTAGLTSAAAAIALALLATTRLAPPSEDPSPAMRAEAPLMASLPIGETQLRLGVTYLPESSDLIVAADGLTADGVHDHELWLVPPQGDLQSLGVVRPGQRLRVALAPEIAGNIGDGAQLVLTREPLGGKPAEAQAGPVVASGVFEAT